MKFNLEIDDRYLIAAFFTITLLIAVLIISTFNSIHRVFYGKLKNFKYSEHVVLITGCDTGFGNMMATQYSKMGFYVIACSYSESSVTSLKGKVGLALKMDVTKQSDIDAAYAEVNKLLKDRRELTFFALINNAGIAPAGCVDWLQLDAFRRTMEVNYFGLIMVTKAFLPLLKTTKGSRIINLSSVAGHVASFTFGAYSGSKHALEGYAKALRTELQPWDIFVCNVNPSFMKTPILQNNFELALKEFQKAPQDIQDQYDVSQFQTLIEQIKLIEEDPQMVINDIAEILTDRSPLFWTFVGKLAFFLRITLMLPRPIQEWLSRLSTVKSGGIRPKPEAIKSRRVRSVF